MRHSKSTGHLDALKRTFTLYKQCPIARVCLLLSPYTWLRPTRESPERSVHLPGQPIPALYRVLQSEVVEYVGDREYEEERHQGRRLRRGLYRESDERRDGKKRHRKQHEKVCEPLRLEVSNLTLMVRSKRAKLAGAFQSLLDHGLVFTDEVLHGSASLRLSTIIAWADSQDFQAAC
jgi:hypothetical protein